MKNEDLEIPKILTAPTAPLESSSDEEYEDYSNQPTSSESSEDGRPMRQAARHRQDAENLVRDHLRNHAQHNPGASSDYVTWIATLHPENADITIDRRFFVPGNAWRTVYEESKNSTVIPVSEAIPVSKDGTGKTELDLEKGEHSDQPETVSSRHPHWCQTCNPIALLFGLAITIPAMAVVFALELVALLVFYLPSIFLYHSGHAFAPPNICTVVLYVTFMLLYWGFWFADYMVLLSSVLVTECLGMVALILGFVTGGCLWATQLHQHLRRVGHGIRVKFRKPNKPTKRKRRKKRRTSTSRTIMPPRGPSCFAPQRDYKSRRQEAMRVITVERERNASESLH